MDISYVPSMRKVIDFSETARTLTDKFRLHSLTNYIYGSLAVITSYNLYSRAGISPEEADRFCKLRQQRNFDGDAVVVEDGSYFEKGRGKVYVMPFTRPPEKPKRRARKQTPHIVHFDDLASVSSPYNDKVESLKRYKATCNCVRSTRIREMMPSIEQRMRHRIYAMNTSIPIPGLETDYCSHAVAAHEWACLERGAYGFDAFDLSPSKIKIVNSIVKAVLDEDRKKQNQSRRAMPDYALNEKFRALQIELVEGIRVAECENAITN